MSSTKRASKNKSSVQDNNTVVQTWSQTISTRTKKTSSTENAVHNVAESLGKIANNNLSNLETINRCGKKDKASHERNKDQSYSDSNNGNEDDIQENNDKANNSDDEDNNNDDSNNNNGDDVSQSGFSNANSKNQQNEETHNIRNKHKHLHIGLTAGKPLYEDELVCCGRNDTVTIDIQLIKGVLPDLIVVLKFLESYKDLVFNGIICCYFI